MTSRGGALVSVVLATRDRPDRLRGALASVASQSHRHLEVIVVDDASRVPACRTVVDVVADDTRFQVLRLDRPVGAAAARNVGMARASGEYLAFLDDDDRWLPTKTERQVAHLEGDPDVGLVTCDYWLDHEGPRRTLQVYRGPSRFDAGHLRFANLAGGFSLVMARRRLLGDQLVIDETFPSVEDWDLWLRCARRGRVGVVGEVLARQVVHGDGRLSDPVSERRGLRAFVDKHADSLGPTARAFVAAHIAMEHGRGWAKRANVARALVSDDPRATLLLTVEQAAKQIGRLRGDPALVNRALVRLAGSAGEGVADRPTPPGSQVGAVVRR